MVINWYDVTGDKKDNPEDDVTVFFYTDRGEMRIGKYRRSMDGRDLMGCICSGWTSDETFYGKVVKWGYIDKPLPPIQTEFEKLAEKWGKAVIELEGKKNMIFNLRCCIEWLRHEHPVVLQQMERVFDTVVLSNCEEVGMTKKAED